MMLYTIYFIFLILQNCLAYFLAVQYGQKVFFIVFHTIMNIHTIFQRIIPFRMFFFYHNSWWPFSYGATSYMHYSYIVVQAIREMEICCYEGFRQLLANFSPNGLSSRAKKTTTAISGKNTHIHKIAGSQPEIEKMYWETSISAILEITRLL